MDSKIYPAELLIQQGKNVLASMKDLKHSAKKKGKERTNLYERFCANEHSFSVYTYIDSKLEQLAEVQDFQKKLELFNAGFKGVTTDFDTELDIKQIEETYEEVFTAYDAMANVLRTHDQALKEK